MWFFYSLYFALWSSVSVAIFKKISFKLDAKSTLFVAGIFVLPFMFTLSFFLYGIPSVSWKFFLFLLCSGALDVIAFTSSLRAIKLTPISLLSPITTATPVFTTLFAFLALRETPTTLKFLGILLIVLGAYTLNIKDVAHGLLKPIKTLSTDRGVQLTFLASLIWAITPIFQKQAILETTPRAPLFTSAVGLLLVTFFIGSFAIKNTLNKMDDIKKLSPYFLLNGFFGALAQLAAFTAFLLTNLGYATAVFKLSVFFTIIGGWLFFKEKRIGERLLGAAIMLAGTLLLAL